MMLDQAALFAETQIQTSYAVQGLEVWQLLLIAVASIVALAFIGFMYFLDSVELPKGTTLLLVILRVFAFVGLLVFFLGPEKKSEKKIIKTSRVSLLVDTSLSMQLRDEDPKASAAGTSQNSDRRRIDDVIDGLSGDAIVQQLRQEHDVVVYRFDEDAKPTEIATFPKLGEQTSASDIVEQSRARKLDELDTARRIAVWAGAFLIASLALGVVFIVMRTNRSTWKFASWALLPSVLLLVASAVTLAVANLACADANVLAVVGLRDETFAEVEVQSFGDESAADSGDQPREETEDVDWADSLTPRGVETRIDDVLKYVINKERGGPVAGIVVFTDGCSTEVKRKTGNEHAAVIAAAESAKIPIHFVGLGGITKPANVQLADVRAPEKIYPGDNFTITALIQSVGMEDETVRVKLLSSRVGRQAEAAPESDEPEPDDPPTTDDPPDAPEKTPADVSASLDAIEIIEEERAVRLIKDGEDVAVEFELPPKDKVGRFIYTVRIEAPDHDFDKRDNQRTAIVEVVERKNHVLLMAGGPTREFRFLRNQLYRDPDTTLDVLLQTGRPGITQEADEILFDFPDNTDDMFKYDCIVAFDPDWRILEQEQIDLLQRWVAEKAGGLILVAGPVYTPEWTKRPRGDKRMDVIRELYPVSFFHQGSTTLKLGRFGGEEAFGLEFSRAGRQANFLWLADSEVESVAAWEEFGKSDDNSSTKPGIYGYYAVDRAKNAATVYARFSDPETKSSDGLPLYFVGQFYGAGRVFFQASGEMWRIRAIDERYFERFYTQLIRWASQGRLSRDSSQGVLVVDNQRCLVSDIVAVRAVLKDAQDRPLIAPEVDAVLMQPDGVRETLKLRGLQEGGREGTFSAQFVAQQAGDYRIVLPVPDSKKLDLLTANVHARLPDPEIEQPQRNDELMSVIAEGTKGVYYVGMDEALKGLDPPNALEPSAAKPPLLSVIDPKPQRTKLSGNPDHEFTKRLMEWLLAIVCGVLCLEWLIRRLSKLA